MDLLQVLSLALIVILAAGVILWINRGYRRHRAGMTPEERALDDEIVQDRLASW